MRIVFIIYLMWFIIFVFCFCIFTIFRVLTLKYQNEISIDSNSNFLYEIIYIYKIIQNGKMVFA